MTAAEILTRGELLLERWAADHGRPCLHHHEPYQPFKHEAPANAEAEQR